MTEHRYCPICKREMNVPLLMAFRDRLSIDEFKISGLCQDCQDDVFEEEQGDQNG